MLSLTLPNKTKAHDISAGWKLLSLAIISALLFPVSSPWLLMALLLGVIGLHLYLGVHVLRYALWMLRPIVVFAVVILLFHIFTRDIGAGVVIILRMLILVALANLVTMTTKLDDMIAVVERLLSPLEKLHVNTRIFGVAAAMVIRFTPVLIKKANMLDESWRARAPKKAKWRIIMPLAISALDDADHVAEALKARGGMNKRV